MHKKNIILDFLIITFGTAVIAAAVCFFMLPSNSSVGSVSAFAMVLHNFIPLPVSAITMILNVILLILGFLLIGKEFTAKTAFGSIMLPVFLAVYELIFPDFNP